MNSRLANLALRLAKFALVVCCLCASRESLEAQALSGRVVTAGTLDPIPGGFVQAFLPDGTRIGAGISDADGSFHVPLDRAGGPIQVRVDAFSYESGSIDVERVLPNEILTLADFVLRPDPIDLGQLRVDAERHRLDPGREWVRRNQLHGTGTFLAGAIIAKDAPGSLGGYVAGRTKLRARYDVRGQATLTNPAGMSPCVQIMVNRWPLGQTIYRSIDEIPVGHIAAIEIYENERDRPPGYYFEGNHECGLIQIWLWNSW